ncbi:MAG: MerR family transcriptional regulator [Pseudomonas sp.]|uniref:MerR family transcriptional regulator n=1 Tax=Pseudomonas sp. TaxID=306 RepID=UPI003398BEBE
MKTTPSLLARLLASSPGVPTAAAVREFTVDELAREAGTTVRNVRAYQDRGLLPPPQRRGRVGIYGADHLARLNLIAKLLERGYGIASIRELFEAHAAGQGLAQVLGLDQAISGPHPPEPVGRLEFAELQGLFGQALDEARIDQAREMGLLEFAGDHLRVPSPPVFAAGVALFQAGIALPALLDQLAAIRSSLEGVSSGIVQMIVEHLIAPSMHGSLPHADEMQRINQLLLKLRPLVEIVVEAELARGLQQAAEQALGERVGELLQGFLERPPAP